MTVLTSRYDGSDNRVAPASGELPGPGHHLTGGDGMSEPTDVDDASLGQPRSPYGKGLRPGPPYGGDPDASARPLSPLCPNTDPPAHLYWGYHCLQDHHLRISYSITCEDYYRLLAVQGGGCGGCGRKQQVKAFSVDHDHETNEIRGLLCDYCNRALTQGIVHYLADPPARRIGPFFIPPDRIEAMERRKVKKVAARKARTKQRTKADQRPSSRPTSNLDRLRAMTKQGGT